MYEVDTSAGSHHDEPMMLTVVQAARRLGIGRTLAYQLADAYEQGDMTGLPVRRIGGCLRVPVWALNELIRYGRVVSDVEAEVAAIIDAKVAAAESASPSRARRTGRTAQANSSAQLTLLDGR